MNQVPPPKILKLPSRPHRDDPNPPLPSVSNQCQILQVERIKTEKAIERTLLALDDLCLQLAQSAWGQSKRKRKIKQDMHINEIVLQNLRRAKRAQAEDLWTLVAKG